ncbi:solute carrier family 20 [Lichtheimia hyalospora FSU 10163]|nr:solute carrier family 20 [Lichtheimia hyalospora FSU 10163]
MMLPYDFTWMFGITMVAAFIDAYGIGANDVANSFATSVSSGSLSLGQACIVACFTEFLGALLLGSGVADTIKDGIIQIENFADNPEMLMMGMMCALIGSFTWVLTATRFGWPVSTTHSIIGAVIGMGIAGYGGESVDWTWDGVIQIIVSWFLSPVLAGVIASIIYMITKYAILRQVDSVKWAFRLVPLYFFVTVFIAVLYICFKAPGAKNSGLLMSHIVGIALGCAGGVTILAYLLLMPWLRRVVIEHEDLRFYHIPIIWFVPKRPMPTEDVERKDSVTTETREALEDDADNEKSVTTAATTSNKKLQDDDEVAAEQSQAVEQTEDNKWTFKRIKQKVLAILLHGINQDVRNLNNDRVKKIHAHAQLYEDDTEYMFSYLQVLTAIVASFAHGSNDVSNAVGPLAAVYDIWQTAEVNSKSPVPIWILAYGGAAIDVGLATMGYRLMRSMGNNITYVTPSRGFAAELGASLTVLTASQLGLPVSTTHCITGAITAVGLCNGNWRAVNWKMLSFVMFGWIATLPIAGLVSGLLFAFAAYGPSFVYLR